MWPKVLVVLPSSGSISWKRARLSGEKGSPEYVQVLRELRLRYFTPMEVAKLMGFGPSFAFPNEYLKERKLHCYRVLGNSLNVRVVAFLAGILFNHTWWTVYPIGPYFMWCYFLFKYRSFLSKWEFFIKMRAAFLLSPSSITRGKMGASTAALILMKNSHFDRTLQY